MLYCTQYRFIVAQNMEIDYLPPEWTAYRTDALKMRDVWDNLRRCGKSKYLRQKTGENNQDYNTRLQLAVFQSRVKRAIQEFAGVLSLNHSVREDTPDEIRRQLKNVDGLQTDFNVWLNIALQNLLRDGSIGWFVGFDEQTGQWKLAQVDPLSIRAPIVIDGKLLAVTTETISQEIVGASTNPYTVYVRHEIIDGIYQYTKFVKDKSNQFVATESVVPTNAKGQPLSQIPMIWLSLSTQKIPLSLEFSYFSTLADLSILHFNKSSELDASESANNIQTLVRYFPGEVPEYPPDIYTGANTVINVGEAQFGGEIKFLEPTGRAIEITHTRNQDRDSLMEKMSRQFTSGDSEIKTATQVKAEINATQAQLLTLVAFIQDAIESTFKLATEYVSPNPPEYTGGIIIDNEAIRPSIGIETLNFYLELADTGRITEDQLRQILQISGAFPRGFDARIQ